MKRSFAEVEHATKKMIDTLIVPKLKKSTSKAEIQMAAQTQGKEVTSADLVEACLVTGSTQDEICRLKDRICRHIRVLLAKPVTAANRVDLIIQPLLAAFPELIKELICRHEANYGGVIATIEACYKPFQSTVDLDIAILGLARSLRRILESSKGNRGIGDFIVLKAAIMGAIEHSLSECTQDEATEKKSTIDSMMLGQRSFGGLEKIIGRKCGENWNLGSVREELYRMLPEVYLAVNNRFQSCFLDSYVDQPELSFHLQCMPAKLHQLFIGSMESPGPMSTARQEALVQVMPKVTEISCDRFWRKSEFIMLVKSLLLENTVTNKVHFEFAMGCYELEEHVSPLGDKEICSTIQSLPTNASIETFSLKLEAFSSALSKLDFVFKLLFKMSGLRHLTLDCENMSALTKEFAGGLSKLLESSSIQHLHLSGCFSKEVFQSLLLDLNRHTCVQVFFRCKLKACDVVPAKQGLLEMLKDGNCMHLTDVSVQGPKHQPSAEPGSDDKISLDQRIEYYQELNRYGRGKVVESSSHDVLLMLLKKAANIPILYGLLRLKPGIWSKSPQEQSHQ